jgi:hypothetical protein
MAGTPPTFESADYPTYVQDIHGALLTGTDRATPITDFARYGNVADFFLAATSGVGGSPYAAVQAYDPDGDLAQSQDLFDAWQEALDALDADDIVAANMAASSTAAGGLVTSDEIDDVVDAFEARSKGAYLREVSRAAVGMFDVGAVLTTQFGMMLAHMERDRADQLNDMDSRLRLMAERERYEAATRFSAEMTQLYMFKMAEMRAGVGGQLDLTRFSIAARQDQIGLDLGYEVSDAVWDLDLINYPMQHIGSLSGAVAMYKQQTPGERLAAAVMQSGSFGLQTGVALKSPAAGLLAGGVSLASQLLAGIA